MKINSAPRLSIGKPPSGARRQFLAAARAVHPQKRSDRGATAAAAEMAFMMPVVKNDWDIYNSRRCSEGQEKPGPGRRVRKVSESRSEGPALSPRGPLSPHRSAPAMRTLSSCRAPPSRASLRAGLDSPRDSASPKQAPPQDKFHSRLVEKLKRALGRSDARRDERGS